ncbi:DUF6415 family natural product biosynthesis protein [Streptomyces formicae]|uniref:Uncharacterized protein n=1 Tax=Streptomyces formicae TaxID=1616117 RepID=A0ABY3WKJ0_9ACTN|nr:DUF6415 family natural product biosynthesis protein [Streptomyces formicae]UNM13138.1 hypothetical protein J4032_18020 [Streptomyces formicae]
MAAVGVATSAELGGQSSTTCEPMMTTRPSPDLEPWTPPHSADELTGILSRLRGWTPFDVGALLDDVADVLDDLPPTAMDMPDLLQRLHAHLGQLATISIANEASEKEDDVARLLVRGAALRAARLPAEPAKAQGHLRQVGWVVNELVERLVAAQYMKGTE